MAPLRAGPLRVMDTVMADPGSRDDDDDATMQRGAVDDDDDLPPDLPDGPPNPQAAPLSPSAAPSGRQQTLGGRPAAGTEVHSGTGAKFHQLAAMEDDLESTSKPAEIARSPAPTRQRPTLLPAAFEQPPKLPGAVKTVEPGLLRPVRANGDGAGGPVNLNRESSDVISTYDIGRSGSEPKRATLLPMAPPRTHAPGSGLQAVQAVPPAPVGRSPVRRVPTAPPAQPGPARPAQMVIANYGPLPLNADTMVGLIAAHRARMATLDLYARALEISAGVLGSLAGGFLITTLVALLVGHGNTLLSAATALVVQVAGICLAVLMMAMAAALRHLASTAAQQAALLEALSGGGR
ncbi:MAG: hypothetical protein EXR77_20240 [Myxococcales bacterium]|nr:hypothetical protein [Myxococcales bacterium]